MHLHEPHKQTQTLHTHLMLAVEDTSMTYHSGCQAFCLFNLTERVFSLETAIKLISATYSVVALGGGPQPGGVVHPPNPRGWLLGDLEWFGPPERNTLRPLRDVLLL